MVMENGRVCQEGMVRINGGTCRSQQERFRRDVSGIPPAIIRESSDKLNFIKKAVNWALRQIAKRNMALNATAIRTCIEITDSDSKSGKWIASHALRELTSAPVRKRLMAMEKPISKR